MEENKEKKEFNSSYTPFQRTMAKIAIGLLLALTVTDFILAVCGAPINILMMFIVLTIFIPIVLYFFLQMVKKSGRYKKDEPDEDGNITIKK